MKRTILTSIILILIALSVQSQKVHDTVFMDKNWTECSRENYTYFRIKTETKDGYFLKDYYKSGQLQSEGYYLKDKDDTKEGPFKYYYDNGNIKIECNYNKGELEGEWKTYYPSGQLHYSQYFTAYELNGTLKVYYENGNPKREELYKDGNLTSSICYKIDGSPDAYTPFTQYPEFIGGDKARIQFLVDNIVYPRKARQKNISGMVYVTFFVDEEGTVQDVSILKGVHPLLDNEAIRVVSKMPSWIPGKIDGENARIQFNMPLKFTLTR